MSTEKNSVEVDSRHHLAHDIRNHLMSAGLLVGEAVRKKAEGTLEFQDLTDLESEITQLSAITQKLLDEIAGR